MDWLVKENLPQRQLVWEYECDLAGEVEQLKNIGWKDAWPDLYFR